MDYVRRIGYVFQANVLQYKTLVERVQDPAITLSIFDISNPQAHDDLLSEVERLLHNVLMALSTRIDQQRAFMRRHFADDVQLMSEFEAKRMADFGGYAPSEFLRQLRNYLTHDKLPVAQSQQEFSQDSFSVTFTLVRRPLLEWDGWKSAKRWLEAQGDQIAIVDLIDSYARIAGSFDKWLHDRIGLKYAAELREYDEAVEAFNREVDREFGFASQSFDQ